MILARRRCPKSTKEAARAQYFRANAEEAHFLSVFIYSPGVSFAKYCLVIATHVQEIPRKRQVNYQKQLEFSANRRHSKTT
jgi:hypothetical protein